MSRTHAQLRAAEAARGEAALPLPAPGPIATVSVQQSSHRRRGMVLLLVGAAGLAAGVAVSRFGPAGTSAPMPTPAASSRPDAVRQTPPVAGEGVAVDANGAVRLKLDRQLVSAPRVTY